MRPVLEACYERSEELFVGMSEVKCSYLHQRSEAVSFGTSEAKYFPWHEKFFTGSNALLNNALFS